MNWNEAIILFIYPSRSRPVKFKEGLDSIKNNLARPELATFVFTVDDDDPTKEEYLQVYRDNGIVYYGGTSKNKIHAVNRSMNHAPDKWDIVVVMSDDMRFIVQGFDDIIRQAFAEHFPEGDGCVHFPDQNQGAACMTMNITDRMYHERFGYIYHEDYTSVECDLENQEVAQMLGRYKFVEKRIFNHEHPSFGQCQYDEQYNRTESAAVHEADKATRRKRKGFNYDLRMDNGVWRTAKEMYDEVTAKTNEILSQVKSDAKPRASIVSKYALGEEVWFMDENEVHSGEIFRMNGTLNEGFSIIELVVSRKKHSAKPVTVYEESCFPTKEALIEHLMKQ